MSRVELLQHLVRLSEERDALLTQNAELKKQVEKRGSFVPAGTRVGSIAEAALQVNGYFESAQRAADDYLREIKRMRDQAAARGAAAPSGGEKASPADQAVKPQDQAAVQEAQAMANRIVARASTQAKAIVAEAQAQADTIVKDANRQARTIINRAGLQANSLADPARSHPGMFSSPSTTAEIALRARHVKPYDEKGDRS